MELKVHRCGQGSSTMGTGANPTNGIERWNQKLYLVKTREESNKWNWKTSIISNGFVAVDKSRIQQMELKDKADWLQQQAAGGRRNPTNGIERDAFTICVSGAFMASESNKWNWKKNFNCTLTLFLALLWNPTNGIERQHFGMMLSALASWRNPTNGIESYQ